LKLDQKTGAGHDGIFDFVDDDESSYLDVGETTAAYVHTDYEPYKQSSNSIFRSSLPVGKVMTCPYRKLHP